MAGKRQLPSMPSVLNEIRLMLAARADSYPKKYSARPGAIMRAALMFFVAFPPTRAPTEHRALTSLAVLTTVDYQTIPLERPVSPTAIQPRL